MSAGSLMFAHEVESMQKHARKPVVCFLSKASGAHYKTLDLAILRRHFEVAEHPYAYTPANVARFMRRVGGADILFSWFANPWLAAIRPLLPRRLRVAVVAGGYDVADCPELRYGRRYQPVLRGLTRSLLERADTVLPVSESACRELESFARAPRVRVAPNAVDLPRFSFLSGVRRSRTVLTVGAVARFTSIRKGHDRFLEMARRMPETRFTLVGKPLDGTFEELREKAPANVVFAGHLSRGALIREMLEASVYAQLSRHEAFGVSMAEAMACGCIPVVAGGGALEEVTRGEGHAVDGGDPEAAARAARAAFEATDAERERVASAASFYRVERREEALTRALAELAETGGPG